MSMTGAWRIVEMDLWDAEAIDLLGPGYIQFGADRTGRFRFIAVEGWMDCQSGRRNGSPCVEFTWKAVARAMPPAAVAGRRWRRRVGAWTQPVGCTNAFMQLVDTRARVRRAGRAGGLGPVDSWF